MTNKSTMLLEHNLKQLKLPTFLREYDKLASQCASEGADHPDYLLRLSELELIDRHHRMVERRIKAARFPTTKSLDTFDFLSMPSLNKALVLELARCEYIERPHNVIALGNSGTGKTHIALGLGLAACQRGLSVGFTTAAALVHELIEARDERRLLNLQRRLARLKQSRLYTMPYGKQKDSTVKIGSLELLQASTALTLFNTSTQLCAPAARARRLPPRSTWISRMRTLTW